MDVSLEKAIQHKDHQRWLSQLNFYQDEVKIFQNTLLLVLHKHPCSLSCVEHVEEYRRILLKKLAHIDELRYKIICHEQALTDRSATAEQPEATHHEVAGAIKAFVKDFEKMKRNLRGFIAHND